MSILRPAPATPAAAAVGKPPTYCNACKRGGQPLVHEVKESQEIWICADWRSCIAATKAAV